MADISKIKLPNNTTYNINATTVNGHTVNEDVPSNAVFTDTNTHRPIQVNGTQVLGNDATALNLIAGDNVSMTNSGGSVTISSDQIDDSYDYDDYQDLPDSVKMQDKIFMVKDAPNPPAIPIVDEYAREQIVDVKSNLTVNVTTANNITYTKEGNKRRIDLQWATYQNVKTFFSNLSSEDKPSVGYVDFVSTSVNFYYVNMALLEISANSILCSRCSAYNHASISYIECSNSDFIKGSLEWYVS